MAQFSLSWDAYKKNICNGLSALQQNGEFVDMTLAADGHHVKVHQMVMSLVSPYIKDLIISAKCSHPVIFLNKVSYATMCSILEYIYTGEVVVAKENMEELVQAGKELRIKGLEDMKIEIANPTQCFQAALDKSRTEEGQPLSKTGFFKSEENVTSIDLDDSKSSVFGNPISKLTRKSSPERESFYNENDDHHNDTTFDGAMDTDNDAESKAIGVKTKEDKKMGDTTIQYTLSNRGSIQLIVNRYIYNLSYTSRRDEVTRRWECAEAKRSSCKATVFTKGNVIVRRCSAHKHPFHDRRILKKVQENLVFSTLSDINAAIKSKAQESKQADKNKTSTKNKNTDIDTTDAE